MAKDPVEPRLRLARHVRQSGALELMGNCERKIVASRLAWSKVYHRVQTQVTDKPKTSGDHVHKKRNELGLHQWQLAKVLGVWRSTLGSWEANHDQPEGRVCVRVIAWLGFSPAPDID